MTLTSLGFLQARRVLPRERTGGAPAVPRQLGTRWLTERMFAKHFRAPLTPAVLCRESIYMGTTQLSEEEVVRWLTTTLSSLLAYIYLLNSADIQLHCVSPCAIAVPCRRP
jgi:hypothetical protein